MSYTTQVHNTQRTECSSDSVWVFTFFWIYFRN
uniref:Uncharacterized protein n=1 Tax=Arundo donax TaxID=35708 RepID=A0A0A9G918_ARUDO